MAMRVWSSAGVIKWGEMEAGQFIDFIWNSKPLLGKLAILQLLVPGRGLFSDYYGSLEINYV